ncbi:hypothetical protein EJK48_1572 [Moraxella catarrhalis]|uniref:Uncharacterized protein n=2 Tax=Moraxella catarrhalis TaxID=480 RepID=A0A3S9QD05_MORCA|nr:hypothetical protein EJK53_1740 [Moraxella catarrhalis]AZQ96209.1 hypothetical protein EJK48_1572 [Moraxella catarrhalis]RUO12701.1 hypothetical protein EJK49_0685 [Moraxella catarrhalis]
MMAEQDSITIHQNNSVNLAYAIIFGIMITAQSDNNHTCLNDQYIKS